MLKELLMEIDNADFVSKAVLASRLNRPVPLVEQGFEELVRMGYLAEDAGQNCYDLPCGKCPYASMCQKEPLKTWSITTKGQNLLESWRMAG